MIKNLIKEILKEDFAGYKSKAKNIKFSHSLHDPLFLKDPDKNVLKAKQLKRIWNEEADHNFFKNEVIKIHWLSDEGNRPLSERLASMLQLSGKDEISAAGYLQGPFNSIWGDVGIILDGHVTFASNDMDTVRSGYYGDVPEDLKNAYKNTSGIPKRPTENTSFSINNMILDRDSFKQNSMSNNEFIIDNWKIIGIIFTDDFCADCEDIIDMGFSVDNVPLEKTEEGKILNVVKESGIPVVRKKDRNLIAKWPFSNNESFVKLKKLIKEMSEANVPHIAIITKNGVINPRFLKILDDQK